jgi:hypothetical protein
MSTVIADYWPEKLITKTVISPASILREQGYKLGDKTKNYVIGEVRSQADSGSQFLHTLHLTCTLLNYEIPLIAIRHGIGFYPAELIVYQSPFCQPANVAVPNFGQLENSLRTYFQEPGLKELISSLYAQCLDVDSDRFS